ncbi:MAG: hypothetical protein ABI297_07745 [Ginsengibacter sp.]
MKLLKACLVIFIVAGFSACEVQGNVHEIVKGTPTKADTVLPVKFMNHQHITSPEKGHETVPRVFER